MPAGTRERGGDAATRVHRMLALPEVGMDQMDPPRCTRCGRMMERGLIMDRARGPLETNAATWIEGAPEFHFFGGLKTRGKERHAVITFRCQGCGYLESYAPASPDSPG